MARATAEPATTTDWPKPLASTTAAVDAPRNSIANSLNVRRHPGLGDFMNQRARHGQPLQKRRPQSACLDAGRIASEAFLMNRLAPASAQSDQRILQEPAQDATIRSRRISPLRPSGETGRRIGLKIRFSERGVRVRTPPRPIGFGGLFNWDAWRTTPICRQNSANGFGMTRSFSAAASTGNPRLHETQITCSTRSSPPGRSIELVDPDCSLGELRQHL